MKKLLLIITLLHCSYIQYGQQAISDQLVREQSFYSDYQKGLYRQVISSLEKESTLNVTEKVLYLLSLQKTGKPQKEELKDWMDSNPEHHLISLARFNYASELLYNGDTLQSKRYLSKVESGELSKNDQSSYAFMSGVLLVQEKNYKRAEHYFKLAKQAGFPDEIQVVYYQSFVDYHLNNFNSAKDGFEKVKYDPDYGLSARYFIAKILLQEGKYDQVISLSQEELSEEESLTSAGFYQLLGEAYARQGNVAKADAFFEKAIQKHPGRPSSALYYQAGVSKFKIGNEEKALNYLTQSGVGSGPYSKLSAFQLGRLYVRRNEPEKALTAYMEASSSEDGGIKEESIYQAAKLNASLGRFNSAIDYAQDYQEYFPSGQWVSEMNDLLAQSYLKTSDYDKAILLLEQHTIATSLQKEVYQKVTFQKAILLFNDGLFDEANSFFLRSIKYPIASRLRNIAYYHLGEIYLRKEKYVAALSAYREVKPSTPEVAYGIGYVLYNQQKYAQAIPNFESAISFEVWDLKQDARLRLADCFYAVKSYNEALKIYQRLPQNDYVLFQQGMISRNMDKNEDAIGFFDLIAQNSNLRDDALFYRAQISFENAQFDVAEAGYTSLIKEIENSAYLSRAFLNRAISRSNLGKSNLAKEDFIVVVENYLQKDEAFSAILGLQDLQQGGIQVRYLDKYIADYKKANPENNSLEVVEFEAAKSIYFDLNYIEALSKITSFLKEYPQSKFRSEASYYLGDAYYRLDSLVDSRQVFESLRSLRNKYTGRVLLRLGDINFRLKDYERALEDYKLLLELNLTPKDDFNALNGLMITSFENKGHRDAITFADKIIIAEWKPLNALPYAKLLKAKSFKELGQLPECKEILSDLALSDESIGAEASYLIALLFYEKTEYKNSLEQLFELTSRFGSYTEWIEKSYLLIADNYIAQDELFQAKATLRSIIQHSQNPMTREVASDKLQTIEGTDHQDTTKRGINE